MLESESRDRGGWHVGFERATHTTVKRKGRGAFMFEGAMMEEWGFEIREGDEYSAEEGTHGVRRLQDGFECQGWVDEEMATVSTEGTKGMEGDGQKIEIETESRNAMEGNRNSVGRALFWNKF